MKRNQDHSLPRLLSSKAGATAIEYGLIAALIATAAIGSISSVGYKNSEVMRCTGRVIEGKKIGKKCTKVGFDKAKARK